MRIQFIFCFCFIFQGLPNAFSQFYNSKSIPRIFSPVSSDNGGNGHGLKFQVGRCSLDEYFAQVHACKTTFYENIITYFVDDCSLQYEKLRSCVRGKLETCLQDSWLLDMLVWSRQLHNVYDNMLTVLGDKTTWCVNGGLESPQYLQEGVTCTQPQFTRMTQACVTSYQQNFRKKASQMQLCKEYAWAKICLRRTQIFHCRCAVKQINQMLDVISNAELNFLPFCNRHQSEHIPTSIRRDNNGECPPWFSSDVIILVNARDGSEGVEEGKQTARCLLARFNYGRNGIRLGFVQFNTNAIVVSIGLHEYQTKSQLLLALGRIKPIPSLMRGSSSGSEALRVAENLIAAERPTDSDNFYPPVVVTISKKPIATGYQTRSSTIVIEHNDWNVDDVMSGQRQDAAGDGQDQCSKLTNRVCLACRNMRRREASAEDLEENSEEENSAASNPILRLLYRKTERLGFAYLPLLFTPVRITSGWNSTSSGDVVIRESNTSSMKIGEN